MRRYRLLLALGGLVLVVTGCAGKHDTTSTKNPVVVLSTTLGDIRVELLPDSAPQTVENFLGYVESKFYEGTTFHRVIPGFVIQGGGLDAGMREKAPGPAIKNEAGNGLKNARGTISMARTPAVDSATSQFFISLKDNPSLDHRDETPSGFGYAVFGTVIEGMDVVDKIARTPTTTRGVHRDVPAEPVVIVSATRVAN